MEWLLALSFLTLGAIWIVRRKIGFARQAPEDYSETGPVFDIRKHLNGPILCEGVIFGPTGRVTSRFVADFDAQWTGDTGRMTEVFYYSDGSRQNRAWDLKLVDGRQIIVDADDLPGPGAGVQTGAGVRLTYRLRLPESSGGHVLDVVDWMYLVENGTIINRSQFRKYGIKVAELVATMRPAPAQGNSEQEANAA